MKRKVIFAFYFRTLLGLGPLGHGARASGELTFLREERVELGELGIRNGGGAFSVIIARV